MNNKKTYKSIIDPFYSTGNFFNLSHGDVDAQYKVQQLKALILQNIEKLNINKAKVADIGCGTGKTTILLQKMLKEVFGSPILIDGFDIHPYLPQNTHEDGVAFFSGDFCTAPHKNTYDIAIMLDVLEHIPDPISYIREVSKSTRFFALHIPLDDSSISWTRNLQRSNLTHPGHLVILNPASAINLLTYSGLRIMDFAFSPVFRAPSGKETFLQCLLNPLRDITYRISPFLCQKLFAGVSLMVLAWSPCGLSSQ